MQDNFIYSLCKQYKRYIFNILLDKVSIYYLNLHMNRHYKLLLSIINFIIEVNNLKNMMNSFSLSYTLNIQINSFNIFHLCLYIK